MKKTKKLIALILAIVLVACLGYVVFAGESEKWVILREYSGGSQGLVTDSDDAATLTGYGAAVFDKKYTMDEGDSVSVTVSAMSLTANQGNKIDVLFTNKKDSFFANSADEGDGLRANITSWASLGGLRLWYSKITSGVSSGESYFPKQVTTALATTVVKFTLTKKTQTKDSTDYTFVLKSETTNTQNLSLNDVQEVDIPASMLSADTFADGLYISTGNQLINNVTGANVYKISAPVYTKSDLPSGKNDLNGFEIVRGYSGATGSLAVKESSVEFVGYGGVSYTKTSTVSGVSVDYMLNSHPDSGYWFSLGLVNKNKAFWKTDGSESQGIVVLITSFSDGTGINVEVKNITSSGAETVGAITSKITALDTKHTLSIYKDGDKWYIVADGGSYLTLGISDVDLSQTGNYLAVGANGSATMKMTVNAVYFDGNIPADAKKQSSQGESDTPQGGDEPDSSVEGFKVIRGYGTAANTGSGLSKAGNGVEFVGYGGACYSKSAVKSCVSVDFQLNERPETGYWFSVGLVNKPNAFWKTDGSESQGIIALITAFGDNTGINVALKNITSSGTTDIGTITTKVSALNTTHTLAFYPENDKWVVAIDGNKSLSVDMSNVELSDKNYITVGANGSKTMMMSVSAVNIDSAMPASAKASDDEEDKEDNPEEKTEQEIIENAVGGFSVVRGYGASGGTGNGLSATGNKVTFSGFGGASYVAQPVTTCASVDFQLNERPEKGYWFSVSLVNQFNKFWKTDGTESQGIVALITAFGDNAGINVALKNITSSGATDIGTITSKVSAMNTTHTLAFYPENGKWVIAIDGGKSISVNLSDIELSDKNYISVGANGSTTMKMSVSAVNIDSAMPESAKASSEEQEQKEEELNENDKQAIIDKSVGGFSVVRGYGASGGTGDGLSVTDKGVTFSGFGGASYVAQPVTACASVDFQLNGRPETGYWFSVSLVNQFNKFWKTDGTESQGLIVLITAFGDNSGINVAVKNVTATGVTDLGTVTSKKPALNTTHTLAFYPENGKWIVAIDGDKSVAVDASKVQLSDKNYISVGANGSTTMKMSVSAVNIDTKMPASAKASGDSSVGGNPAEGGSSSSAVVGGFAVVRGYDPDKNSGKGLSMKGDTIMFDGFGGASYIKQPIKDAVSVTYKLGDHPETGYWFSIGLVNAKGKFWKPDGSESQGVVVLITAFGDGSGINVEVKNVGETATTTVTKMTSKIKALGEDHVITFYRDGEYWSIAVDGSAKAKIAMSGVKLGSENYLTVGASNKNDMHMEVSKIFIDGMVTESMKSGVLVAASAGNGTAAEAAKTGGTSYDKDGNLMIGEITKGSSLDYIMANNRLEQISGELPLITYILIGVLGLFTLSSLGYLLVKFFKKKRGEK